MTLPTAALEFRVAFMPKLVVALGASTSPTGIWIGVRGAFASTAPFVAGNPIRLNRFAVMRFPLASREKFPARVNRLVAPLFTTKNPFPCRATFVSTPVLLGEPFEKFVSMEETFVPEPNWMGLPDPVE